MQSALALLDQTPSFPINARDTFDSIDEAILEYSCGMASILANEKQVVSFENTRPFGFGTNPPIPNSLREIPKHSTHIAFPKQEAL
jgi:hypothetical protein